MFSSIVGVIGIQYVGPQLGERLLLLCRASRSSASVWRCRHQVAQSSIMSPSTRPKSRRLRVTTVAPISFAIAAIRKSLCFTFNLALTSDSNCLQADTVMGVIAKRFQETTREARSIAACSPACGVFAERANADQPPLCSPSVTVLRHNWSVAWLSTLGITRD